jgi:hypothetical protein
LPACAVTRVSGRDERRGTPGHGALHDLRAAI